MKTICVYCGSADGVRPVFYEAARAMGNALAETGYRLVYGAGATGLMGAVANAALEAGGHVIGVIPSIFNTPTLAHMGLSELEVVENIHIRKARMIELADGFIALPGGYGTLEELFEALTWAQIGLHEKPVGLLNVDGYYDPLLALVEKIMREGFIYAEHRAFLEHSADPLDLISRLSSHRHPGGVKRWMERSEE
jgi:uncharacterized protein (TIGR00730 family)